MKTAIMSGAALVVLSGLWACQNEEGRYLNLTSGEEVVMVKDEKGRMVEKETGRPVMLYVDQEKEDTFYGVTGRKINGQLRKVSRDSYVYFDGEQEIKIDGDEYKVKTGSSKEKWDADGSEYKYKDDDIKIKNDGDYKVKGPGYTKKVDEDGDVKIKTNDKKIKIDGETGERKVKERSIFGKAKDKIIGN